jgi:hypothetical protein
MVRLDAALLLQAMLQIGQAQTAFALAEGENAPLALRDLQTATSELGNALSEVPVSLSLTEQYKRVHARVRQASIDDWEILAVVLTEFHNNLIMEMTRPYFLMIPTERRWHYQSASFGDEVDTEFPEAASDIAAAGRCIAVEEWTAAVFHLMRVLEHGLRALAADVGLAESQVELQNWQNVIDRIERAIREREREPRSIEKSESLRAYSAAASQLRYFKDAWRNHVSHARAYYDEREAMNVWSHAQPFMQDLARFRQKSDAL